MCTEFKDEKLILINHSTLYITIQWIWMHVSRYIQTESSLVLRIDHP